MSRTRMVVGALGVALVTAVAISAIAPISSAQVGPTHIELFNVEGRFEKDVDVAKPGFGTAGDYAVESQPLLDPVDGSDVGRSLSQLTIVRPVSGGEDLEILLQTTMRLADGDLVAAGGLRFSELFGGGSIAVIGGSGAYFGAHGTVAFSPGTVAGKDGFVLSIDIVTS